MGNQVSNKLHPYLDEFLQDVAQGVYGDSKLTYTDIMKYSDKATENDIEELKEFFWEWTSELTDEDDIEIGELDEHIYNVINNFKTMVINIIYYSEVVDNWGRMEASMKGNIIFSALNNVNEWTDDMVFEDDGGRKYSIDELAGKEVNVPDIGIFTVPKE